MPPLNVYQGNILILAIITYIFSQRNPSGISAYGFGPPECHTSIYQRIRVALGQGKGQEKMKGDFEPCKKSRSKTETVMGFSELTFIGRAPLSSSTMASENMRHYKRPALQISNNILSTVPLWSCCHPWTLTQPCTVGSWVASCISRKWHLPKASIVFQSFPMVARHRGWYRQ